MADSYGFSAFDISAMRTIYYRLGEEGGISAESGNSIRRKKEIFEFKSL
jgi:hypothetical protein